MTLIRNSSKIVKFRLRRKKVIGTHIEEIHLHPIFSSLLSCKGSDDPSETNLSEIILVVVPVDQRRGNVCASNKNSVFVHVPKDPGRKSYI